MAASRPVAAMRSQAARPRGNAATGADQVADEQGAAQADPEGGDGERGQPRGFGQQPAEQAAGAPEDSGDDEQGQAPAGRGENEGGHERGSSCDGRDGWSRSGNCEGSPSGEDTAAARDGNPSGQAPTRRPR